MNTSRASDVCVFTNLPENSPWAFTVLTLILQSSESVFFDILR